jgi:hypothetical protein
VPPLVALLIAHAASFLMSNSACWGGRARARAAGAKQWARAGAGGGGEAVGARGGGPQAQGSGRTRARAAGAALRALYGARQTPAQSARPGSVSHARLHLHQVDQWRGDAGFQNVLDLLLGAWGREEGARVWGGGRGVEQGGARRREERRPRARQAASAAAAAGDSLVSPQAREPASEQAHPAPRPSARWRSALPAVMFEIVQQASFLMLFL